MMIFTKRLVAVLCFGLISSKNFSQQVDLFKMQDSTNATDKKTGPEPVLNTFYSTRLVNGHTVEITGKGSMDFRINHRFAPLNLGFYEMFGLDAASMRIGFDFGLADNLCVGIGRTTFFKEYDGFIKYRLVHQKNGGGAPISITLLGSWAYRNLKMDPTLKVSGGDRTVLTTQLLIARKFSDNFSFQLSPSYSHYNRLLFVSGGSTDMFALGFLVREKVSKRISINAEYFLQSQRFTGMHDPLSIGVDINTGGHVFQLHFTNSQGMNEHSFIHETSGTWGNGDVRWGFNVSRIFHIGKKK
jgi:hypothetical protein